MKKTITRKTVVSALLFLLLQMGCKKEEASLSKENSISEQTASMLKIWLVNQKSIASEREKSGIDSLLQSATWEKGIQFDLGLSKTVIYVPLDTAKIGLAFFYDTKTNTVDSGNIVRIKKDKNTAETSPLTALVTFYEKVSQHKKTSHQFSGRIDVYAVSNRFKYDYGFENGEIKYCGSLGKKPKSNGDSRIKLNSGDNCWHWYHVDVYADGRQIWTYLYSVCYCGGETTTGIGLRSGEIYVKTNCGEDGSATSGPPVDPSCNFSLNDAAAYLEDITVSGADEEGPIFSISGATTTEAATGKIREPYIVKCRVLKFDFKISLPVYYSIYYDAIRYKDNSDDVIWKWEAVDYVSVGQSDGTMPPCYDVQVTCAATQHGVIATDKRSAEIAYQAYAQYKITCVQGWQQGRPVYMGSNKTFWAAHPFG